jgi:hypothetical protein
MRFARHTPSGIVALADAGAVAGAGVLDAGVDAAGFGALLEDELPHPRSAVIASVTKAARCTPMLRQRTATSLDG